MRKAKPIKLVMPSKLYCELNDYLDTNKIGFHYRRINFYFVVDYLINLESINKKEGFMPINLQKLKRLTVSNIDRYIKVLRNGEFIICDNEYKLGEKSLYYRINPKLKKGYKEIELQPKDRIYKKVVAEVNKERAHDNRLVPHLKQMKNKFMSIEIDHKEATSFVLNEVKPKLQAKYLNALSRLENKRMRYFKRNSTNSRLDTNLTNLSSTLKPFLTQKLVSIDLKNSQPLLLGILLNTINYKLHTTTLCSYFLKKNVAKVFGKRRIDEVLKIHQNSKKNEMVNLSEYLNQVQNGTIYDSFSASYGGMSRKEVKNIIFKVLFSKNKVYSYGKKRIPYEKEKKTFAEVYPEISAMVEALKEKDHKALPIYLQKIESFIFIDCIAKELCEQGIVPITIHDSVMVEPKHLERAKETIERVFKEQTDILPKLHIEAVNFENINQ